MQTTTRLPDIEMKARALSRWENEGGALIPTDATPSIDESEMRILARLGAAMLEEWTELAPPMQKKVIRRARALGSPDDHARVKRLLADFLNANRSEC